MQLRICRDGKQHEIKVLRVASAGTKGAVPGQQPAVQGCLAGFLQLQDQDFQSQGRYHEGMEACSLQSVGLIFLLKMLMKEAFQAEGRVATTRKLHDWAKRSKDAVKHLQAGFLFLLNRMLTHPPPKKKYPKPCK